MNSPKTLLLGVHLTLMQIPMACAHGPATEHTQQNSQTIAFEVAQILEPFLLTYDMSRAHLGLPTHPVDITPANRKALEEGIRATVEKNNPLVLRCLCFPFKSNNKNLVLGPRADMAERQALMNINGLIARIKSIYPKARFEIVMDGLLFNDLFQMPDDQVIAYEKDIQTLCQDLENIKVITFRQILKGTGLTYGDLRASIDQNFQKIKQPPADKFEVLKQRIALEIAQQKPLDEESLEKLATHLLKRDQGMLAFLASLKTAPHLHLSIHLQPDFHKKIGVNFVPQARTTPWNALLVEEPDGTYLINRKDRINLKQGTLSYRVINGLKLAYLKRS